MKKIFTLVAICVLTLSACEYIEGINPTTTPDTPAQNDSSNLKLKISSESVMEFPVEGGAGEITFYFEGDEAEIAKKADNAIVTATCKDEWITDILVADYKVTFNVAENPGEERSANITLKHEGKAIIVMVEQLGIEIPDVTFTATHLGGSYFGRYLGETGGITAYNYFVILGDMRADHYQSKQDYATEYRFDIYSDVSSAFNKTHRVPVGTYTIDHSRSGRAGTIDGYRNCSYYFNSSDTTAPYNQATLVVTEDSIVADILFLDGSKHRVEYHGDCIMEDYIRDTYADVYPVSQHTEDITFNVTSGYVNAKFRGDYYGTGCDVWFIDMIENKSPYNGVYLIFDLLVPQSAGGFDNFEAIVGEYTLFERNPESYEYTIPTGRLRDDSLQMHAWYLTCVNSQVDMSTAAPLTSGTVKVTKDGNAYKFEVNGTDDNGNKIIGTFSGLLSDFNDQSK